MPDQYTRRAFFLRAGGMAAIAAGEAYAPLALSQGGAKVAPITMVINQSPWFNGFRRLVELYEKDTGNHIELDVNPYSGSLAKIRNSLQSQSGTYDLLAIDNNWMVEMFDGGFLMPLAEIDPAFELDPKVSTYGGTIYWNDKLKTFDPESGKLQGVPINGNVEVLFYRKDLYEQKGLRVPETWDQLLDNTTKLTELPRTYGFVHRDDRESALADFCNYMFTFNGDIFANAAAGDFTIVFNSPANRRALEFYLKLGKAGGYPTPGSLGQGPMIQLMLAGKSAHAIAIVGAWAQLDDPAKSAVVGKIDAAVIPKAADGRHASRAGHWIGGIARNVPRERQLAALEFLKWFQTYDHQIAYTRFGAVPIREDLAQSPLAADPKFRFLKAQSEASKVAKMYAVVPEAARISSILSLRLNECIIGQKSIADTLNQGAEQVHELMVKGGRKTGRLPALA